MRFTFPYEITKLYAIKEKEPDKVDTEVSYAFAIQENFDIIRKYLNEIIDADNIVQNSITGGTNGSLALTTITGDNIFNNTITGTQLATDSITLANLGTAWTDWTPTYDASGDMSFSATSTFASRYCKIDTICFFNVFFEGTTGGTAGKALTVTLPFAYDVESAWGGGCRTYDTNPLAGCWNMVGTQTIYIYKNDYTNWGLGALRGAAVQGFYQVA